MASKNKNTIVNYLKKIVGERPIEVRVLKVEYKGTISGYYDNFFKLSRDIRPYIGKNNIYFTMNEIDKNLINRAYNKLVKAEHTTADKDIKNIRYILIDLDPIRPSGISSTDVEYRYALELANQIKNYLINKGIAQPIVASSGNGCHILIRIYEENNKENIAKIKNFLLALNSKFSNKYVEVDKTTYNASRICRLYGTISRKDENMSERPHRYSKIIEWGDENKVVKIEEIEAITNEINNTININEKVLINKNVLNNSLKNIPYTFDELIEKCDLDISHTKYENDCTIHVLNKCPWNDNHTDKGAYIIEFTDGGMHAGCHHSSCSQNNIYTLLKKNKLNYREKINNIDDIGDIRIKNQNKINEKKLTQCDILTGLVNKKDLIKSDSNEILIEINIQSSKEMVSIKSEKFKQWLIKEYYKIQKEIPNQDNINKVVSLLEALGLDAKHSNIKLDNRIVKVNNEIIYDLNNPQNQVVIVSKGKYEVVNNSATAFKRHDIMQSQVTPIQYEDLSILDKYFRYKDINHLILQKVAIVASFIPDIPRPIVILHGQKGSSKTYTMKIIKSLIDPSSVPVISMPKKIDDMVSILTNNYYPCIDNIRRIDDDRSDLLCTSVTGGGFIKRKLYTNNDPQAMFFKRAMMLNGINVVARQADLLDRSILLELERIPDDERKLESELDREFNIDKPKIIGAIFYTLCKAMQIYEEIDIEKYERLADFTKWGYAIAEVSGIGGEVFLNAYSKNKKTINLEAVLASELGNAIYILMKDKLEWQGTATELYTILKEIATQNDLNTSSSTWPKAPNALTRRANEIQSNLKDIGILFTSDRSTKRKITLKRI